ncbi:MAG: hypothetical protein U0230_22590 [Polyangiales bacterium]
MSDAPPPPRRGRRFAFVTLVAAVAVAIAGYLTGTARMPTLRGYRPPSGTASASDVAPVQAGVARARYASRVAEERNALTKLAEAPRGLLDTVTLRPGEKERIVAERATRRAYDGAPPTIPHGVDQQGAPACLACHEHGMRVNDRVAPAMSHESYASCLQCHAPERGTPTRETLAPSVATTSSFEGTSSPTQGERAWPGAPPTIPHRTFMRERCASCHGTWATGLASTHPWRQSCTQCHAPSAPLDQRPRSTFGPIGRDPGASP